MVTCPSTNCGVIDVKFSEAEAQNKAAIHAEAHRRHNERMEQILRMIRGQELTPPSIHSIKEQVRAQLTKEDESEAATLHPDPAPNGTSEGDSGGTAGTEPAAA